MKDPLYNMKREMLRRGLTHKTIMTYIQCVKQFMIYCRKDMKKVTRNDVRDYIDMMVDKKRSSNTLNVHINALKFLLGDVMGKRVTWKLKFSKVPKQLPVCLTKQEVVSLFEAVKNPSHRLILELIYSSGLRVGEAVRLKKEHIEIERGMGWVRAGKGRKDRPFIIAECLKKKLEKQIDTDNSQYVFPGRDFGHLSIRSVQDIVKQAARNAGVRKSVHPHSLRHSFATHLIEDGYDILVVQPLLGHESAKTTQVYLHTALPSRIKVKSPYDSLKSHD